MKNSRARECGVVLCLAASAAAASGTTLTQAAQPLVVAAEVPQYPQASAKAGEAGTVSLNVTTNGREIVDVRLLRSMSDSPLIQEAALRNVRTWRFAAHAPAKFDVRYRYTIVDRPCDAVGRDTHAAAIIRFPVDVEIFAERDAACSGDTRPPPSFGIYIRSANVPFFPAPALANGVEGTVRIGVTYKGVLSLVEGPPELGQPMIEAIRDWMLMPGPFNEEMTFTFKIVDGDCKSGGPMVTVGPGLTSYEIAARPSGPCR